MANGAKCCTSRYRAKETKGNLAGQRERRQGLRGCTMGAAGDSCGCKGSRRSLPACRGIYHCLRDCGWNDNCSVVCSGGARLSPALRYDPDCWNTGCPLRCSAPACPPHRLLRRSQRIAQRAQVSIACYWRGPVRGSRLIQRVPPAQPKPSAGLESRQRSIRALRPAGGPRQRGQDPDPCASVEPMLNDCLIP